MVTPETTLIMTSMDCTVRRIEPYLALAKQYGWANAMYQTNQV